MPYRRLPNTDQMRLRALTTALAVANQEQPENLRYSQRLVLEVRAFSPQFEQALQLYTNSRQLQSNLSAEAADASKKARLYLSHFIQVFNMCIARGEIQPEHRKTLGLDSYGATLPDLRTDRQLLDIGQRVIEGEEQRMAMGGGNRIYNPSIAVVKAKLSLFSQCYNKQHDLLQTIEKHHSKLDSLRERADSLILELWNKVEASLAPIDSDEKRNECSRYGIVYFYRPYEKQKDFL